MATLYAESEGRWRVQFVDAAGKRRSVRLGRQTKKDAASVKGRIEELVEAKITAQPLRRSCAMWLGDIDGVLYDRLAKAGLVEPRLRSTLGGFLDDYIERANVKESTLLVYKRARKHLVGFFGEDRELRSITAGDADAWRSWLVKEQKLADNTVRRTTGMAKQYFGAAKRSKLVEENPFADLTAVVRGNPERFYFVTREEAAAVLDACPNDEWRALFALARYGGLRVPSEVLALTWGDIDWERERFTVRASKTAHHEDGGVRVVPMFPELKPYLVRCFEAADEGQRFVIGHYRCSTVNLRTQLQRIIQRAGLPGWPKLWQNLRSARQTELADRFPAHVVTAWIGNSVRVAEQHYLQTTEAHLRAAVQTGAESGAAPSRRQAQRTAGTPLRAQEAASGSKELQINGRYRT